jgi:hypothetical protein
MGGDHLVEALCGHNVVLASSAKPDEVDHYLDLLDPPVLTGGFSEAELREAGAVAVYHSIVELRHSLDEWLTS